MDDRPSALDKTFVDYVRRIAEADERTTASLIRKALRAYVDRPGDVNR